MLRGKETAAFLLKAWLKISSAMDALDEHVRALTIDSITLFPGNDHAYL